MAITVNTSATKPVTVVASVAGMALDEAGAQKMAMTIRDAVASHLGYYSDDQREAIEVTLSADGEAPAAEAEAAPDETPEPESETEVVMATEDEIAAMTPEQYRKAKADGRI